MQIAKCKMANEKKVRIGAMTLQITRTQKQAGEYYDLLFALADRLLPGCGCDVVLLPERCAARPGDRQPADGAHFQRFAALARKHSLYLLAPLVEADGASTFNTHVAISPAGQLLHAHRKIHLAPGEEKDTQPGDRPFAAFELPWFTAGLLICFDNHFPESSRCLALAGAEVLFWPAFGNVARPMVEATRCVDNNIYLVSSGVIDLACDLQADVFNRGAVLDPAGKLLADSPAESGLAVADLPLDPATGRLAPWPAEFDYMQRRMPAAYQRIVDDHKSLAPAVAGL